MTDTLAKAKAVQTRVLRACHRPPSNDARAACNGRLGDAAERGWAQDVDDCDRGKAAGHFALHFATCDIVTRHSLDHDSS